MANKRIPQLPNRPVINGLMLLGGYDPATDTTVNLRVQDVLGEDVSTSLAWNPAFVYNTNDAALLDNILWVSQQDNNVGVMPGTDPAFWVAEGESPSTTMTFWQAGVFTKNNAVVMFNLDGRTQLFRLTAVAPFNSTNFLIEYAAGKWAQIGHDWPEAETDSTISPIVLEVGNSINKRFIASDPIGVNKAFQILGVTFPRKFELFFELTAPVVLTWPSSVLMADFGGGEWNPVAHTWTAFDIGKYFARATRFEAGGQWYLEIKGPFV